MVVRLDHLQTIGAVRRLVGLCQYLAVRVQLLPIEAGEHLGLGRQTITLRPVVLEVLPHQVHSAISVARVHAEVLANDARSAGFLEVFQLLIGVNHLHATLHVDLLRRHLLAFAGCFAHPLV